MPKIVVAEDEMPLQMALKTKLESAGLQIIPASNGQEAINQIISEKPDLILLDVMMPVKDGFEVLEEIKANPETQNIPVIFLTNFGQEFMKEQGKYGGAVDYFVKTDISLNEILQKVQQTLGITQTKPLPAEFRNT